MWSGREEWREGEREEVGVTEAGPFGVASSSSRLRGAAAADRLHPVCVRACVCCAVLEGRARCERMMHLIRCEERRKERVGGREGGGEVGFHWEGEGVGGKAAQLAAEYASYWTGPRSSADRRSSRGKRSSAKSPLSATSSVGDRQDT